MRDALSDPPPSSSSVEVRSPYRRYRRSKEVWASFHAPQLSGNSTGCGCHHLHSVDIRYGGTSDLDKARKDVRLNFTSLLSQRPSKHGMDAGSLYCIWAPICTEESKVNIDLKTRGKAQTTGCFDFSGNVTPSTPQTQEQRIEHSTFGTVTHHILQRKWSGSWSCWCADVHAPPDTMIIVWHYILLMKKMASHHLRWEESVHL